MCRSNIDPAARSQLARVMTDIAQVLADEAGVPVGDVLIGPVDFGDVDEVVAR